MRVVIDTNVLISAVFWHGPPFKCLAAAEAGRCVLVSGDRDLTALGSVGGVVVLTPRQFVDRLAVSSGPGAE